MPAFTKAKNAAELKTQVEEASRYTARFLFRFWDSKTGGSPVLNTVDAIVPRAFAPPNSPPSLFEEDIDNLDRIARLHLNGEHVSTPFSSWSHSLEFVLEFHEYGKKDNGHLCILDTSKLDNVILHAQAWGQILTSSGDKGEYAFEHEYLAYGIISGPGYKAVPWEDVDAAGIARVTHRSFPSTRPERLAAARRIAALFGEEFELPVFAYLMTMRMDDQELWETTARDLLRDGVDVPEEWRDDPTIIFGEFYGRESHPDADKAVEILGWLVQEVFASWIRGVDEAGDRYGDFEQDGKGEPDK